MKLCNLYQVNALVIIYVTLFGACYAEEIETPLSIAGATKVNAEQVVELANSSPDLIIIDSRITGDRQKGYIESSISLPNTKTNCGTLSKVLPGKNLPRCFIAMA